MYTFLILLCGHVFTHWPVSSLQKCTLEYVNEIGQFLDFLWYKKYQTMDIWFDWFWFALMINGQWASPFENFCRSIFYCNRWAKTPTIQKSKLQWCIPKLLKMETNEMNLIGKLMNLQQFKMNRAYLFQRIMFQNSLCKWRTPKSTIRKKLSMW